MQNQQDLELMCPKHGEKIITVEISENGQNKLFCIRCATEKQVPIEEMTSQLADSRQKKIKILIEQGSQSEQRLRQLLKMFTTIKQQFNEQIDGILKTIDDGISQVQEKITQEQERILRPILNLTRMSIEITEWKQQRTDQDDVFFDQDEQLRNKVIIQYLDIAKSFNSLIKQGSFWRRKTVFNKDLVNQYIKVQEKQPQYQPFIKEKGILICYAMAMDQSQKILVNGRVTLIQVWDLNIDGKLKLRQTLNGHTEKVFCLCFSKKEQYFLSGSWDKTIRIWKLDNKKWICQQVLQAHKGWVNGIVLSENENEFISCSEDQSIKIWMKNGTLWECAQTLSEQADKVQFLNLSPDCNLLASSGANSLRIWEKAKDNTWKHKQKIVNLIQFYHLRILFIENNELLASTIKQGNLLRFINKKGFFELTHQIKFNNEVEESTYQCFPIIYIKELGLIVFRQSDASTYILKKQDDGQLVINQVLNGNYMIGYLTKDAKYLIMHDYSEDSLVVYK